MTQLLFIGGLGSNRSQVDLVANQLSTHYKLNVIGVPFSEALKDLAHVARLAQDSIVITHSAGILVCEHMTPQEIIAVAPPVPTNMSLVTWRALSKSVALIQSGNQSPERSQKIQEYHSRAFFEHVFRPQYNIGQASAICRFDPALLAVKLLNRGSGVTLGFMNQDLLYPKSARHAHVTTARGCGAIVHEDIDGHHDEFLLYPLDVLRQMNRL